MRKIWIVVGAVVVLAVVAAVVGYRLYAPVEEVPAVATTSPAMPGPVETPAGLPAVHADDRILGNVDAPVTAIEYASLTCPHCAAFHNISLPRIKTELIDKGIVRFVYRDFPLDQVALRAALLARCVPDDRYFSLLEVLFRTQSAWAQATDPAGALAQIGRTAGLSQEKMETCLADETQVDRIAAGYQEAQASFDVRSTPTFIINGEKHNGALAFEDFERIVKSFLPKS